jgi:hypothetical protein
MWTPSFGDDYKNRGRSIGFLVGAQAQIAMHQRMDRPAKINATPQAQPYAHSLFSDDSSKPNFEYC